MRKVFVSTLIVLAVIAVGASVWALFSKTEEPLADSLYEAIPLDAGLIIDVRNYNELCHTLRENDLWNVLTEISSIGNFSHEMLLIDSLVQQCEPCAPFRNNVIFSFHPVGNDEMKSIGYVKMNSDREARNLTDLIKGELSGKAVVSQRMYDQTNITDVAFNNKNRQSLNFVCAYRNGVFFFSHSSILLEYALRQITTDSNIAANGKLTELIRSAGKNAPANIYINYKLLPRTASTVFHARHSKLIEPLTRFADWTELDLNIKSDLLLLNGFTACSDVSAQWFDIFLSQPALPIALADAMPSTTYSFLWLGIRQLHQYFTDYSHYLENNKETDRRKELERLKTNYRIDLQNDFAERFEDEAALVFANVGQTRPENEPFTLFRIKSTLSAVNMIEEWQSALKQRNVANIDKSIIQFDKQLSFTAYRLPFDVPALLFGDIFAAGNAWCVVVDNYLVFGSSIANLQRYLHYTALNSTLQTNPDYGQVTNLFSTRSNLTFYGNPAWMTGYLENTLKANKHKEIQQSTDALSQMQAIVYQLNSASGKLYNNLFLKTKTITEDKNIQTTAAPVVAAGTQTAWESLLDTAISFKPHLVRNHSTGETDIFVQDMSNNAYLLNSVGRIVWKVKLPEAITGNVYQVDIYRNGKLQMLFNTRNYIYVIDRLGNIVDKFPLALKSPAVGSVALFDYDGNRQYRMMIACEDRKVYVYDNDGKTVEGWSFRQSEHPVQTDIYHFRTGNRDYIVFADKYRVYILDRQGRTRVSPERNLPVGKQTMIALDPQRARLLLTDTLGTIHSISLANGSMSQQSIKPFAATHFFVFQDVDGDGQGNFIFASGNRLEVYRQDAKQIFSIEMQEPITVRPYVYEFANRDLRIGIVQPQNNLIWLYDNKGNASKGFPLKGSSPFTIGRIDRTNNSLNLFVGSKNNFLYNYSVR